MATRTEPRKTSKCELIAKLARTRENDPRIDAAAAAFEGQSCEESVPADRKIDRAFLRPDLAARYLGVSRRTLSNWTRRGVVPVSRVGRRISLYATADLRAAVERFKVGRP